MSPLGPKAKQLCVARAALARCHPSRRLREGKPLARRQELSTRNLVRKTSPRKTRQASRTMSIEMESDRTRRLVSAPEGVERAAGQELEPLLHPAADMAQERRWKRKKSS